MRKLASIWTIVAATQLVAAAALAQASRPAELGPDAEIMRAACGQDAQQLCRVVPPGQGRVYACLLSRQADVSDRCRAFLRKMQAPQGAAEPPRQEARQPPEPAADDPPSGAREAPQGARPAQQSEDDAPLRRACGTEVRQLCSGVPPEGNRVLRCLAAHRWEVSNACRAYLREARERRREAAPRPPEARQPPDSPDDPRRGAREGPPPGAGPGARAPQLDDETPLRRACAAEARQLCGGVPPGRNRVLRCLMAHRFEASGGCRAYLREARERMREAAPRPRY